MKRFTASSSENFMHRPGLNITQYFLGASQQEWTTEQGIKGFHLPCAGQTLFPTRIKLGNLPASGFSCKKLPDVTQQMYSSKECYDPDKICDVPYMGVLQLVVKGEVAQPLLLLKIITFFFFSLLFENQELQNNNAVKIYISQGLPSFLSEVALVALHWDQ